MGSNTNYNFILERMHDKLKVTEMHTLDNCGQNYSCGRSPQNRIICSSILVSRKHCIFICERESVYISDLKSSNGVYINGTKQEPLRMIKLDDNDIIGIGCPDVQNIIESDRYVFRLRVLKSDVQHNESTLSNTTNTSILQSTVVNNDCNVSRKRMNHEIPDINPPAKVQKVQNNHLLPSCSTTENNSNPLLVEPKKEMASDNDSDVEIVHVSCNSNKQKPVVQSKPDDLIQHVDNKNKQSVSNSEDLPTNHIKLEEGIKVEEIDLGEGILRLEKDIKVEDVDMREDVIKVNDDIKIEEIDLGEDVIMKENTCNDQQQTSWHSTDTAMVSRSNNSEPILEKRGKKSNYVNTQTSTNVNCDKNVIKPTCDSIKTEPGIEQDIFDISNTVKKELEDTCRRDSLDVPYISSSGLISSTPKPSKQSDTASTYHQPSKATIIRNGDSYIKMEDELMITDDDEEVNKLAASVEGILASSPFKLKQVKQEPKTRFSEIDVVDLSDDEEDIFPCSQLFDDVLGGSSRVQEEVKEDCNIDNDDFPVTHDGDIITVSDDEDDEKDNEWLRKLSQSQVTQDELDTAESVTDDIEEALKLSESRITDDIETSRIDSDTSKPESEKDISRSHFDIHKPESITSKPQPGISKSDLIHKSKSKVSRPQPDVAETDLNIHKPSSSSKSQSVLSKPEPSVSKSKPSTSKPHFNNVRSAFINDIFKPDGKVTKVKPCPHRPESDKSNDTHEPTSDFASASKTASTTSSSTLSNDQKEKLYSSRINNILNGSINASSAKKIQEIDPPHFYKGRRKSTADTSPRSRSRSRFENHADLSDDKTKKSRKKRSRKLGDHSGSRKHDSLSKEERQSIITSRKEKLKTLATEQKTPDSDTQLIKRAAKAKAKITIKNRGDFLVEDQEKTKMLKPRPGKSKSASTQPKPNQENIPQTSTVQPEKPDNIQQIINHVIKPKPTVVTTTFKDSATSKPKPAEVSVEESISTNFLSCQKENHSPNRLDQKKIKTKKKVSFPENYVTIKEYEIDPGNRMNKLKGKDAPIPSDKLPKKQEIVNSCAKLEKFLLQIFCWNPVWLEEQQRLKSTPPVVREEELHPMLTYYSSYEDYYRIVSPLLLLEFWYGITKEFATIESNPRRPTIMYSIAPHSIQRCTVPSTNLQKSILNLEVLITKQDLYKQAYPIIGDLVFLEYVELKNGIQTFRKVFAYVTNVHQTILVWNTEYNKDLRNYVKDPYAMLIYTITTKALEANIATNRIQRMRTVTYLRANMRMVQALEYLPMSPLVNMILYPKVDAYQLLPMKNSQRPLVTQDRLNPKQLEAVLRVTDTILQKEPKLCFIQGPPGTGKSKVIENIVTQVLYENNRYEANKGSIKILLCAPSNAAIDELVRRLLTIRSHMKQNRFKMVRIGRPETMHPSAKEISVTELARREVKRTTSIYASGIVKDADEEMTCLEAKINAHKSKQSSQSLTELEKKNLRIRIDDMTARYALLQNRKKMINEVDPKEVAKLQRAAETTILSGADIITCTLSSCYTNQMESIFGGKKKITVCIVDEATQSYEAETLIPLMLGISTMVLVGDPNQLPATVLSQRAKSLGLDQSLFSRIQNTFTDQAKNPVIMLDMQYRMASPIVYWPNRYFYSGRLKNASQDNPSFPFHAYRILNHDSNQNFDKFSNTNEAQFIARMIACMIRYTNWKEWKSRISIGILTPYQNQRSLMLSKINEKLGPIEEEMKRMVSIEVNTVDSFQGQERDVIIMSCVRSHGIGFLSDKQRLCVALTRAKYSLILCGNFNAFLKDQMWYALLRDAKTRNVYFNVNSKATMEEIKTYIVK